MPIPPDESIEERLARLEAQVAELRGALADLAGSPPPAPPARRRAEGRVGSLVGSLPRFDFRLDSQFWLSKVGIGLLLFGVAFLFRYAVDLGWLTEWVRVGFGLALAGGLLAGGLVLHRSHLRFSQVLLGGGIATLYITGFAAYQLYTLVGFAVAFAYMIAVTVAALVISLRQDDPVLAIIGAMGAFGTPFLLHPHTGRIPGLIVYASLVIVCTGALYLYRGWRSLLWTASVGGWAVLFFALEHEPGTGTAAPRGLLQAAVVLAWLTFWAVPLARALLGMPAPEREAGRRGAILELFGWDEEEATRIHLHLLSITSPVTALALTRDLWSLSRETWGALLIGTAALHALIAWALEARSRRGMAYGQASAAAVLLTIGLVALLRDEKLYLALAVQAALLHLVARRMPGLSLSAQAHLLFLWLGGWFVVRLFEGTGGARPLVSLRARADLIVLAVALLATWQIRSPRLQTVYRLAVHLGFLGWLWRELGALPSGQAYVTIAWGASGVLLLLLGLRRSLRGLQSVALGTLLLLVAKLFLVDLRELAVLWRILLFLGFGGAFLLLSYYLQVRWKAHADGGESS